MNGSSILDKLGIPFLEALGENDFMALQVPKCLSADSLFGVLERQQQDDEGCDGLDDSLEDDGIVTRQITDLDGCRSYAQIMAIAALVMELQSG